jgi:hypothetical protein
MRLPKVLGFTPIYSGKDYCLDEWIENLQKFTYANYEHIVIDNTDDNGVYFEKLKTKLEPLGIKVYHVSRGENSREALAKAQNFAREIFLRGDYDYFFSLESDIFPKPNIVDALVSHGLNVVGGLYMLGFMKDDTRTPCIMLDWKNEKTNTWGTRIIQPEQFMDYLDKGVKEVAAGGLGATLIYRKVVEKVPFTYIPGLKGHSDVYWCNDARKLGYVITVDTGLLCEHKNSDWTKVADR